MFFRYPFPVYLYNLRLFLPTVLGMILVVVLFQIQKFIAGADGFSPWLIFLSPAMITAFPILLFAAVNSLERYLSHYISIGTASPSTPVELFRKSGFTLLFPPIGLLIILVFFSGLISGFYLLSLLPWIGKILFLLLLPITFVSVLFIGFTHAAFFIAMIFLPAITLTWKGDAFAAIFQCYSIIWSRPIGIFRDFLLNLLRAIAAVIIPFCVSAVVLFIILQLLSSDWLAGSDITQAGKTALFQLLPFLNSGPIHNSLLTEVISFGLRLFLAVFSGLTLVHFTIGQLHSFAGIKKQVNDINLLET